MGIMDAHGATDLVYTATARDTKTSYRGRSTARLIVIGDASYLRNEPGGRWQKMDSSRLDFSFYGMLSSPRSALEGLGALRGVSEMGRQAVHGVTATLYEATTTLAQLPRLAPPAEHDDARLEADRLLRLGATGALRTQVLVDDRDLVRRIHNVLDLRLPKRHEPPSVDTTEFYDFGPKPSVREPPDRETDNVPYFTP